MPFYAVAVSSIISTLRISFKDVKQVWLADDASAAGKLKSLASFFQHLSEEGIKYGYFVNEVKSWLILRNEHDLEEANEIFKNFDIQITTEGQRHLGAALGTKSFKEKYVGDKVKNWIKELENLCSIAETQPQAAYSAYIHGYKHKFTYYIRTIPDIDLLLRPLLECICDKLIPTIFECDIPPDLGDIISMPTRLGGLGIGNVMEESTREFQASKRISAPLAALIVQQRMYETPDPKKKMRQKKCLKIVRFKELFRVRIGLQKLKTKSHPL